MEERRCQKCGARAAPLDTQCMDCGADLLQQSDDDLSRRLDDAMRVRLPAAAPAPPTSGSAAFGTAALGETSEATRLRIFDRHEAERLKGERVTAYVTAGMALVACVVFGALASNRFDAAGGVDSIEDLSMKTLRDWSAFTNPGIAAVWYAAASIASLLCAAGQIVRGVKSGKAIALVEANEKPEIVGISMATQAGMLIYAIICPPFGIIVGIIMKLSKDENTSALGGMVLLCGFASLAILVANVLWGIAAAAAAKHRPQPEVPLDDGAMLWRRVGPVCAALALRLRARGR
ncbi:MAG: hypothetical protein ACE5O2_05040 [Armatimonadota bacterium]